MSTYINPFLDWSFKHIFGREQVKDILIGFLNALFDGKHVVKDIQYSNNERTSTTKDGRTIIHDIYCITDTGERLIVEMQNKSMRNIKDRALYYTAKSVVDQGEPGDEWRYSVNAVYGIFFLNFLLKDEIRNGDGSCLSEVALMNTDTKVVFNDNSNSTTSNCRSLRKQSKSV